MRNDIAAVCEVIKMSSKIVNSEFHTGERYIGEMNGEIFTVLDIEKDTIRFKEEKTGKISTTNLDNAKRLLLKKL